MPDIQARKPTQPTTQRPLDIFEVMRREMDRVFDRFEFAPSRWPALAGVATNSHVPSLDVKDTGAAVVIEAELPGVSEKDVSVTLRDGILTIKGEKKSQREEKNDNYVLTERSYGSFERSLSLPDSIDEARVDARFEKGVLKVTVPKKPEAAKAPKQIEVKAG